MTKTGPAAEHASARAFNDYHPLGTPVRYWKGVREGDGKVARTRTEAQLLSGHTAVIWLEGVSGCIALTHIQPITEGELAAADRIPAPRPIPTTRQRLTDARSCGHTPDQHRHDDGQAADAASHDRALRELTAERDAAREDAERYRIQMGEADAEVEELREQRDRLVRDLDSTGQVATFRQGVIDLHAAELGAAGEVLAVVRDAQEQIERALARYDTQPGVTPVEAAGDDQAEEDDLRSPLAAERDQLVETIGRLVSLPPEQIAKMHKVGYSGMSAGLGSPSPRAQEQPEREEIRWAYRWIGTDGQVYDEMDASDNAIETAEQRAHRIAAKRLTGTVRGEVVRYRVLTMPAEVVATYPAEARP